MRRALGPGELAKNEWRRCGNLDRFASKSCLSTKESLNYIIILEDGTICTFHTLVFENVSESFDDFASFAALAAEIRQQGVTLIIDG